MDLSSHSEQNYIFSTKSGKHQNKRRMQSMEKSNLLIRASHTVKACGAVRQTTRAIEGQTALHSKLQILPLSDNPTPAHNPTCAPENPRNRLTPPLLSPCPVKRGNPPVSASSRPPQTRWIHLKRDFFRGEIGFRRKVYICKSTAMFSERSKPFNVLYSMRKNCTQITADTDPIEFYV